MKQNFARAAIIFAATIVCLFGCGKNPGTTPEKTTANYPLPDPPLVADCNPGIPGGGNGNLQIVRAYYGLNNRTNDVTQLLRSRVQNGMLVIQVNNNNMGGDPAVGGDKVLTVIYRYQGREQTSTVKEGNTLRIP